MSRNQATRSAILLVSCPDRMGLVAAVTEFIHRHTGNILDLEQHVDESSGRFFMRVQWALDDFDLAPDSFAGPFRQALADGFDMDWTLHVSDERPRLALFVSKLPHCLYDILARVRSGEWDVEVPLIVSNHRSLEPVALDFGIDFHHVPVDAGNKPEQEMRELELLERYRIDLVVLARYMQILSEGFIARYPNRIINIHHSFLPAFPGGRPYQSAHRRGVKIIGATSHYVTADLDAGPIIEQDVVRISHSDAVVDLVRKGRDLEKIVLARAVWSHLQRKVLVHDNRTVVFV